MTDKELLELAAKAVDVCVYGWFEDEFRIFADIGAHRVIEWNPLTDDGDALRLAVKLEMDVVHFQNSVEVTSYIDGDVLDITSEEIADCRLAATRRAIVRAAAAIGEKL